MNKSAVSLALAGTLSLAALAGCGSSSATSSPSTRVSSTTTPSASAASSPTSAASSDAGTATPGSSATGSPSTTVSSSTTSSSTPSATSSTASTPAATTIRIAGATLTVYGWRFTAPFGWGHATTTKDGDIYHNWVSDQSQTVTLLLVASHLDKNENFNDDIRDISHDFGMTGGVDVDAPVSITGADQAQELAGQRTEKSKTRYLDLLIAHKGRDLIAIGATAPSKALLMSSGAHDHLMSLAHV